MAYSRKARWNEVWKWGSLRSIAAAIVTRLRGDRLWRSICPRTGCCHSPRFFVRGREGGCSRVPRKRPPAFIGYLSVRTSCADTRGNFAKSVVFAKFRCAAAAILAASISPRHPLPPPLSLNEDRVGLHGILKRPRSRNAWGFKAEIKKARKNGPFYNFIATNSCSTGPPLPTPNALAQFFSCVLPFGKDRLLAAGILVSTGPKPILDQSTVFI